MKRPRLVALGLSALCVSFVLAGVASPAAYAQQGWSSSMTLGLRPATASASAAAAATPPGPNCTMSNNYLLYGAQFVNGATVNGTFYVWTVVHCPGGNVTDMALSVELDLGSTRLASSAKGFTGVPRADDGVIAWSGCAHCNGTYHLSWGQVLQAPPNYVFGGPQPAGCYVLASGMYLLCVAQQTVKI